MRAVPGAVQHLKAGVLVQVGGDLAGVVDAVVVADHRDHRGPRGCLDEHAQQCDEVGCAAAAQPVHPGAGAHLDRPEHGDLPVRARGGDLRADGAQRPAGPYMGQQVQVGLVLGEYHRPAGQVYQPGHDRGHHVVMVRIAAGGQPGPPPDRHQPDPPVQRPRAGFSRWRAWQQVALGLCMCAGRSWRRWLCHQVHIDDFKAEADDPLYKPGEGSLVGQLGAECGRLRACGDLAVVELRAQRSAGLAAESDLIYR